MYLFLRLRGAIAPCPSTVLGADKLGGFTGRSVAVCKMNEVSTYKKQGSGAADMRKDLSVVLPVYNESECIRAVVDELCGVLSVIKDCPYEIILVNDGSTDDTPRVLADLRSASAHVRVLTLVPNSGQSAAFSAGFRNASGSVTVAMDADGQNDPNDIPRLLEELKQCDCCCGYRANRKDSFSRRYGSKLANFVRNAVLGESIVDTGCSLKAFRTDLVRDFPPLNGMHRFIPSYLMMKGAVIRQIPVNHRPRKLGTSKYTNIGRLAKTVWDLMAVKWMKCRYQKYTLEMV